MLVKKKILPVGNHLSQGGIVPASPEWCQEKVDQFKRFKEKGIKVPVSWAHNPDALPQDPKARETELAFHQSKYKAGDILDLTFEDRPEDPGPGLWINADVPAVKRIDASGNLIHEVQLPDGTRTEGAIGEVSAGFWHWKDGENELHKDCLIHVALTPLPVVSGQKGFVAADFGGMKFLSTRTLFGGMMPISSTATTQQKTLATELKMADDIETTPETETEPEEKGDNSGKSVPEMLKVIGDAFKIGLPDPLPTDATEAITLVYTAACVVKGPHEEEQVVPEQQPTGPMMLSTALAQPGALGLLAKNLDKGYRDGLVNRINALKDGRGLTEQDHTKLLAQVPKLQLSLNDEGQVERSSLEDTLDVLERNMPSKKELATKAELEEHRSPAESTKAPTDAEIDEKVAKMTGRKNLG